MAARLDLDRERPAVVAAPGGKYGFGTLGLSQRPFARAWRMVQRAGLARFAARESARFAEAPGGVAWVEYDLTPAAWAEIPYLVERARRGEAR